MLTKFTPGVVALTICAIGCWGTEDSRDPLQSGDEVPDGNYEFVNGSWFDGNSFVETIFYSVDGLLTRTRPGNLAHSFDLTGKFVVPPYAEAHTHTLMDRPERIDEFLQDGIFYAKVMNATISSAEGMRPRFNKATSLDVVMALAGITASNGHPLQIGLGWGTVEELDGDWLHLIDTREDLEFKWPLVLNSGTDFVKAFLIYSNEYAARKNDPNVQMRYRALDPVLLPQIVERAHAAGLQVACHVRTAADFHNAIAAGVDEIAHVPGFSMGPASEDDLKDARIVEETTHPERFLILEEDAQLAASRGVVVQTTVFGASGEVSLDVLRTNLELLKRLGVTVIIGSDSGEYNAVDEVSKLDAIGAYSNLELIRILCQTTPRAIFPDRKIGRFLEGYEASLLVLAGNPVGDLANLRAIDLRIKQGHFLRF